MGDTWLPPGLTLIIGEPGSGRSTAMWAVIASLGRPFTVLDCSDSAGVLLRLDSLGEDLSDHVVVRFPPDVRLAGRLAVAAALGTLGAEEETGDGARALAADDLSVCLSVSESEAAGREERIRAHRNFLSTLAVLRWHGVRTGTPSLAVLRIPEADGFARPPADALISILGGDDQVMLEISAGGLSMTGLLSRRDLSLKFI